MGGGRKVPYPKHVWSPAGGWYAQPPNWKRNTAIATFAVFGICAIAWRWAAQHEEWAHRPKPGEWYPSRYWSKQLIEWDKEDKLKAEQEKAKAEQERAKEEAANATKSA
ncbi:hypothetical protein CP533_1944 [Ophiocordyceps camponoti-saundersi (nom. inval.)]|nr:hypothetical protein CP533_1944 [Ophiocordyceps camponoti-saundersi (nom. inval.)]